MSGRRGTVTGVIPKEEIVQRQETLRKALGERGLSAALAVGRGFFDRPGSFAYFTGHIPPFISAPFDDERGGAGLGVALIDDAEVAVLEMFPTRPELIAADEVRPSYQIVADTIDLLKEKGLSRGAIGVVDGDLLPWTFARLMTERLPDMGLVPFDGPAARMRSVKSPAEIEALASAADVADRALAAAREAVVPGATEREVCAAGIAAALLAGADFVRYLRVHSGSWSLVGARWPQATSRRLNDGDYVAVDVIGTAGGYAFDVLRCFVAGNPSDEQRRLTHAASGVTQAVVSACRPGMTSEDLRKVAGMAAENARYGPFLDDFIGHGIGLETVEWPLLGPDDATPLEPGMVLCIEPGIIVPDIGGARIEEEIVVTEDQPRVLTNSPREL
jgi:Xaa-Pro dipeptidase